MIVKSYGDLAHRMFLRNRNAELKQNIETLGQELASGKLADITSRLGGDFTYLSDIETNLTPSLRLFQAAAKASIPIVFVSSVAVHHHMHDRWQGLVDEEHPTRPGNLYGALKASLEAHLWALNASHGITFTSLRPAAVYGIDPTLKRSIGYPIVLDIMSKQAYERTGGGKFVHVEDVAAAAVGAA